MAEATIPCSSGCAVKIRRIRDRYLTVKCRNERYECPGQDTPSQSFAARLSFFTLRARLCATSLRGTIDKWLRLT